jgi:hypothetical protein
MAGTRRNPVHDPRIAGRRAECDGGGLAVGGRYIERQEFTGTLTGDYYDEGDPPWRWVLLVELTRKPDGYLADAIWCESESVFVLDE